MPFGENTRYDLVIDDGQALARVQCKTGRLRNGAVRFAVCSFYGHHPHPSDVQRDYHGEVDYFCVHCPETGGVYLVPIEDLPVRRQAALRVDPTRNGQRCKIRSASEYEVGRVPVPAIARNAAPPELRREMVGGRTLPPTPFDGQPLRLQLIV
jgi:PD-(D/E)XK endonuclease